MLINLDIDNQKRRNEMKIFCRFWAYMVFFFSLLSYSIYEIANLFARHKGIELLKMSPNDVIYGITGIIAAILSIDRKKE